MNFLTTYSAANAKLALILKSLYLLDTYFLRRCHTSDQGRDTFIAYAKSSGFVSTWL